MHTSRCYARVENIILCMLAQTMRAYILCAPTYYACTWILQVDACILHARVHAKCMHKHTTSAYYMFMQTIQHAYYACLHTKYGVHTYHAPTHTTHAPAMCMLGVHICYAHTQMICAEWQCVQRARILWTYCAMYRCILCLRMHIMCGGIHTTCMNACYAHALESFACTQIYKRMTTLCTHVHTTQAR